MQRILINNQLVEGLGFVWDGCHKIYIIEDEEDIERAKKLTYIVEGSDKTDEQLHPLSELEETYNNSCPLRFIDYFNLRGTIIPQYTETATFELLEGEEEKLASGRKINKMVFLEREEIGAETVEFLECNGFLELTDYGNVEFSKDDLKLLTRTFNELHDKKVNDKEITLQQIREEIGLDIVEDLENGNLDFIQIIY